MKELIDPTFTMCRNICVTKKVGRVFPVTKSSPPPSVRNHEKEEPTCHGRLTHSRDWVAVVNRQATAWKTASTAHFRVIHYGDSQATHYAVYLHLLTDNQIDLLWTGGKKSYTEHLEVWRSCRYFRNEGLWFKTFESKAFYILYIY